MRQLSVILLMAVMACCACRQGAVAPEPGGDDTAAVRMLQGVWVDDELENVAFLVRGDTIVYADSVNQPTPFRIVGDTLELTAPGARYRIVKISPNVFSFKNQSGDVVRFTRSTKKSDFDFFSRRPAMPEIITEVRKTDTVVVARGERYHCYIAINPTRYKVVATTYNDDGVKVANIYYDNIIHISVYKGAAQLYSRDIRKEMYSKLVPRGFVGQAILSGMEFDKADDEGFHFYATLCRPDAASCYMLDTKISYEGRLTMEVVEY